MEENSMLYVVGFCCVGPLLLYLAGVISAMGFMRVRNRWTLVERRTLRESEEIGYSGGSAGVEIPVEPRRPASPPAAQPAGAASRQARVFQGGPQAQARVDRRFHRDGG